VREAEEGHFASLKGETGKPAKPGA